MKPLILPEPCPICGKGVVVETVTEWHDDGTIVHAEIECETEPDIDSDEWSDWHAEHYAMPYVDWLPYEVRALKWLAERYTYDGSELKAK
jgi:hypothetical protein